MQNCKWKTELVTLGIAVVVLAGSLALQKAQAQEYVPFLAWITKTNGMSVEAINLNRSLELQSWLKVPESAKPKIASILVPEHVRIDLIDVKGCVNLTNLVIQPPTPKTFAARPHIDGAVPIGKMAG